MVIRLTPNHVTTLKGNLDKTGSLHIPDPVVADALLSDWFTLKEAQNEMREALNEVLMNLPMGARMGDIYDRAVQVLQRYAAVTP